MVFGTWADLGRILAIGTLAYIALALLVLLQFLTTWTSVRSHAMRCVVKSEPSLLSHRGGFLEGGLRPERATRDEVVAAVGAHGIAGLALVEALVLERGGSMSAIGPGESEGGPSRTPTPASDPDGVLDGVRRE